MSYIIGLGSTRPTGVDMVYLQVSELVNETIFNLDRTLRKVVSQNPRAEWSHFIDALSREGFTSIMQPRDNPVFIHSRPWDEHLISGAQSFFVTFPESAPYELAGRLLLLAGLVIGRHLFTRRQHTLPAATLLLRRALRPLLAQKLPAQPVSAYLRQLAASQTQHREWLQQLADYYEQAVYAEQPQALAQLAALLKRRRRQVKQLRSSIKNA